MIHFLSTLRTAIVAASIFCICSSLGYAQAPRTFSYQGTLTDQVQTPFPDSIYRLTFTLYDSPTGGASLWQESHDVSTLGGVFDVNLGSATPLTMQFDKQMWLGITVQGNAEMLPRTPLVSTPYSLFSETSAVASALSPNATGAVLSLNGLSGNLTLQGGGKTSVSQSGSAILISSLGGIDRIDAADGSLTISNPTGPAVALSITDGGITTGKLTDGAITTSKLADNAVTALKLADGSVTTLKITDGAVTTSKILDGAINTSKLSSNGANTGQALTFNGTNIVWGSPSPSGAAGGDLTGNYPNPSVMPGAITTAKIADGAITTGKVADGAVISSKVNDGAITTAKLSSAGAVNGQVLTFNGTSVVWGSTAPTGAAGGDLTGNYPNPSVTVNAITTAKIADGAITMAKLSDAAVTMDKIADAQVTAMKINPIGATSGQALTFNGTNVVWGSPSPSGAASGDLTGNYPNPNVAANAITTAKIADGAVTTSKVNDGAITTSKVNTSGATSGQALTFNGTNIVWGSPSPSGAASGDLTGNYPNPSVALNAITTAKIIDGAITTAKVNTTGATSGQALTFNGTNVVWGSPSPSGAAGGDLTGTYPNPTILTNAVTTSKILDANVTTAKLADASVTTLKINDGAITTAKVNTSGATSGQALTFNGTNVVWGSPSPSGAASGDLTGNYPNPSVAANAITTSKIADGAVTTAKVNDGAITTSKVNTSGATSGQALTFNGTTAVWGSPSPSGAASGDLTGNYPNPSVAVNAITTAKIIDGAITTSKVNTTGATSGQALTFNGTSVVWGSPSPSGAASGDLTGNYPNPSVAANAVTTAKIADGAVTTSKVNDGAITTAKVNTSGATSGQALTFNGTTVVWGSPSPSGAASGDLTGNYPNPSVAANAITTAKIADGSVTTVKVNDGAITTAKVNTSGATSGQALTFNGTNVVWGSPSPSGAASGDLTGNYPNPSVAANAITTSKIADGAVTTAKVNDGAITTSKVNTSGATSGQALTFNGTNVVWGSPSPSGAASGDLTGNYPNPSVAANAITTAKIADAAVTTAKVNDGAITTAKVNTSGATLGQALTFNGTNVVWGSPSPSGAASGDLTGNYPNPSVAANAITTAKIIDGAITTSKVNTTGATSGQALTFNGTNVVWGSPSPSGAASGDLTGNYPNPNVAANAITTAKIADGAVTTAKVNDGAITTAKVNTSGATSGQALTFNGTNVVWGSPSPSGAASGDLTGNYPNPSVAANAITTAKIADGSVTTAKVNDGAITTAKVNTTGATSGQALTFNGTNVVWGSPSPSGAASGDLTGNYPNPTITTNAVTTAKILDANITTAKLADASVTTAKVNDGAITTAKVNTSGATSGQALTFNGTNVVWGSPSPSGAASGDLTGNYPNPSVAANAITTSKIADGAVTTAKVNDGAITTSKVNTSGATSGQALTFDGTNVVWGSPSPSGAASGDLTGNYPNPTITTNAVTTAKILDANVTTAKLADGSVTNAKVNSAGATSGQALTFNGTNVVWGSPSPSGAASGDLTGNYPNPSVAVNAITSAKIADGAVTTSKVNTSGATSGQALTFNGTNVVWGSPSPSGAASGDLTGNYPNPTITTNAVTTAKILDANVTTAKLADGSVTNAKVNSAGATSGQALTFNGTNVVWGSPSPSGAASGDLTGNYPNPTITTNAVTTAKILDANITTAKLADASVTTLKVNDGAITTAKVNATGATSGQALTFNGTNVVWGSPSPSGAASGDLTGNYPNPSVAANAITTAKIADGAVTTSKVNTSGATSGQALTFDGTTVVWGSPSPSGAASGDLTGNYPNPSVAANAITSAKIADGAVTTTKVNDGAITTAKVNTSGATSGQALTFDGTNVVWGSPSPSGAASGDLTGNYPNPSVAANAITSAKIADGAVTTAKVNDGAITTAKVNTTGATLGQALTFDGSGVVWGSPSVSGAASGDLTGNYPNPNIAANAITTTKILDANVTAAKLADGSVTMPKVNSSGASSGQALTFNGTSVAWGNPSPSGAAGGDLSGTYPNPTVAKIQGRTFAATAPTNGQSIVWNQTLSQWEPSTPSGGNVTGPASATDNAISRFDLTTGKLIQNSALLVDDYTTSTQNNTTLRADDGATANISLVLSAKGTGALMAGKPDGAAAGGNARGQNAVDWQMSRSASTQVASGNTAVIGGGANNTASGTQSTIGGGQGNAVSTNFSTISGGNGNAITTGLYSTIAGGNNNLVTGDHAVVSGGNSNKSTSFAASVGGGYLNSAQSNYSSIPGGYGLRFSSGGADFGYNAWANSYQDSATISAAQTAYFGNVDLWLGNTRNQASKLKFFTAQATGGQFPLASTYFTAFQAGAQTADITYTLPTTAASSNGQVLSSTTGGVLSWVTANAGNVVGPASATDNAITRYDATTGKLIQNSAIIIEDFTTTTQNNVTLRADDGATGNINLVLSPKGTGALVASKPGGGADARGLQAVDWQMARSVSTQVAAGDYSTIGGGRQNTAASYTSTVAGGILNSVTAGNYGVVSGGNGNTVSGSASNIGGGSTNTNSGTNSVIAGGVSNMNAGNYSTIGGGLSNNVSSSYTTVSGGNANTASSIHATVSGGINNTASGNTSSIGGGNANTASQQYTTIGGGNTNQVTAISATVSGGSTNTAGGVASTISGGFSNSNSGDYSTILGGRGLTFGTNADRSVGFHADNTSGTLSMTIDVANVAVFGNTNFWLANNNNTPSELRFFEAYNTSGAFPNTANYTAFKAGVQAADITYTLPTAAPTSNGQVLAATTSGVMSWVSGNTGDVVGPASATDNAISRFDAATGKLIQNSAILIDDYTTSTQNNVTLRADDGATANIALVLAPKGNGGLLASKPDGTTVGGNARGTFAVDLQTYRGAATHVASGNYSTIGGGSFNTASGLSATISGGANNIASGSNSSIGGGGDHTSSGNYTTIGGGSNHQATQQGATVSGGMSNQATNGNATVGGGTNNIASGGSSTVSGGNTNTASQTYSTVSGGINNLASQTYATVSGGVNNTSSGMYSAVGGGRANTASGVGAFIGGGGDNGISTSGNTASGVVSTVLGGYANSTSGDYSAILGGRGLTLGANADRSIGFHSNNSGGTLPMTIDVADVAVFGNSHLWLANNNNTPSELRFFEAYNTSGAFPNTANYTAFKAGVQAADITYTLPTAAPTSNGQVLASTTAGVMSWVSGNTGDVVGPASATDNAISRFDAATGKLIQNSAILIDDYTTSTQNNVTLRADDGATANIALVLFPKGNGGLLASKPDGSAVGGNARGIYAVDLQMSRSAATQVASGSSSFIGGGASNTSSATGSTVSGGVNNTANVAYGTVGGGNNNTASTGAYATVGGGSTNIASGAFAPTVAGGNTNTASGQESFVGGGFSNTASAIYTTVAGGTANTASGGRATVSGGSGNQATNAFAVIGGGNTNTASGSASVVTGGTTNTASGQESSVNGGLSNVASGSRSAIGGGVSNTAAGDYSAIPGGHLLTLTANADYSFGFLANSSGGANAMTLDQPSTALFGNANLWLANNNSAASQLRFYEANGTNGTFPPALVNYTAFQAGAQSADITYTLPTAAPTSNGQVLASTTAGVMSWATVSAGLTNFTESVNTAAPNATVSVVQLLATNGSTDVDIALTPKGAGALTAQIADNGTAGGNKRGSRAVDWQLSRTANTQVASGANATIGGGRENTAIGQSSVVAGGANNNAGGNYYNVIGGGNTNMTSGDGSTIAGGTNNFATAQNATVAGGANNSSLSIYSTISGGWLNSSTAFASTVGGGIYNKVESVYSTIPGGYGMRIGNGSFGFNGFSTMADSAYVNTSNTAYFGNVDLWLGNTRNQASQLRFYTAQASDGTFPAGTTYYSAFQAGTQAVNVTYTLPTAAPTINGQALVSTTAGVMSWASVSGGLTNFTESINTAAPNATVPVVRLLATNAATDVDVALTPKGMGALAAHVATGDTLGGNKRGVFSVDWQMSRSLNTQVASGYYSVLSGGYHNTVLQEYGVVSGGQNNSATSGNCVVAGGQFNTAGAGSSTVSGGGQNNASGVYASIGGGQSNASSNAWATIGGGASNAASGQYTTIAGGQSNISNSSWATVGGGASNTSSGQYAVIGGGLTNSASGQNSTVSGGTVNSVSSSNSTIGGGQNNTITTGGNCVIAGGQFNSASGGSTTVSGGGTNNASAVYASIGGGFTNAASSSYSTIGGGQNNQASSGNAVVAGGQSNVASGGSSAIGGGGSNTASANYTTVSGGQSNTAAAINSSVLGGRSNSVSGDYSSVIGGRGLTLGSNADQSFGFLANTGSNDMTVDNANTAVFGNTHLWLANNNSTASELRFYEANATTGTFPPASIYYTAFKAGDQTANLTYTLPITAPTNGQVLSSTSGGVLSWANAGGITNFTESINTSAPNATVPVVRLLATYGPAANVDIALTPKGTGALTAQVADNTTTGGNKRGENATDWQSIRFNASEVASANYSTISGGVANTASGYISTVSGGYQNTNVGDYSAILGGRGLTFGANADHSVGYLANVSGNEMTINTANTAVFGNTNLWLANNSGTASELRFYELTGPTSGTFPPTGTNYVAFKSGVNLSTDYTYTLPTAYPVGGTGRQLTSTTTGTMSWGSQTLQVNNYNIDCGNLAADGGTAYVNVVVTGAVVGGTVTVSPRGDMEDGVIIAFARVSAADNVRIKFVNATGGAIDPAAINVDVTVVQP